LRRNGLLPPKAEVARRVLRELLERFHHLLWVTSVRERYVKEKARIRIRKQLVKVSQNSSVARSRTSQGFVDRKFLAALLNYEVPLARISFGREATECLVVSVPAEAE
jgi:hypothetical protein